MMLFRIQIIYIICTKLKIYFIYIYIGNSVNIIININLRNGLSIFFIFHLMIIFWSIIFWIYQIYLIKLINEIIIIIILLFIYLNLNP